jgi:hypothetical protein
MIKKVGKVAKAVKTAVDIKNADNKGEAVGNLVAGAAAVTHPIVGTAAAPIIRKGVEAAVNKGLEAASNPETQAKVQATVASAAGAVKTRVAHFFDSHGKARN